MGVPSGGAISNEKCVRSEPGLIGHGDESGILIGHFDRKNGLGYIDAVIRSQDKGEVRCLPVTAAQVYRFVCGRYIGAMYLKFLFAILLARSMAFWRSPATSWASRPWYSFGKRSLLS